MIPKTFDLNLSLIDAVVFQLKSLLRGSDITETDYKYLAYIHVYPDTYDKMIIKDKISVSKQSVAQKISLLSNITLTVDESKLKIVIGTKGVKRKTLLPLIANLIVMQSHTIITNINIK
jgi:ABC-type polysaccharide/polyol phosphate transport system ATPase subunit